MLGRLGLEAVVIEERIAHIGAKGLDLGLVSRARGESLVALLSLDAL